MAKRITYAPQVDCPRCGSIAGKMCRTPSGRPARWPHEQRELAMYRERPDLGAKQEALNEKLNG